MDESPCVEGRMIRPRDSFVAFPREAIEQSIPSRFEQQVRRDPARLAVCSQTEVLSYAELDAAANGVAHAVLAERGVGEEPIALLFEQGASAIAAMLGLWKAGRGCVPLDPGWPPARSATILAEAQAPCLLASRAHLALACEVVPDGCLVRGLDPMDSHRPAASPTAPVTPDTLAYLFYTSGTTGPPKGVMQTHRTMLQWVRSYTNAVGISADDRHTLLRSHSFGGAAFDILGSLLNGAAVYSLDVRAEGVGRIAEWLIRHEITLYRSPATLFRHFAGTLTGEEAFPYLRCLFMGGEPVDRRDVELYRKHFLPPCVLVNGLGITEAGAVVRLVVDHETPITGDLVPVGYPHEDVTVLLLDEAGREVGVDEVGEIAVRGPYLSPGYWRRPELTAAAFHPDPAGGSAAIYRTGDMGRFTPDGCLLHLGRKDFQVRIRGQRVEVTEIEMALLDLDGIREAAVVAREDQPGEARLVAYLVPERAPAPTVTALRRALAERLPSAMVPSQFVLLDALPLTATNKLDRKALPPPGCARPELETAFVAPRTPLEEALARLWAEVLGLDAVGIDDHFMELGGHSLLATRLLSRVRDAFQVEVPLPRLFAAPTVAGLAVAVLASRGEQVGTDDLDRLLGEVEALPDEQAQQLLARAGPA
jgi:amino acid adenylation domain-containing protein